jgi:hemerythrin-like domain-containing protein
MAETIRQLRDDHANIRRLLDALEHQVRLFVDDGEVDYEVMEGVLEYMSAYPDLEHHPREDMVLRKIEERDPAAAAKIGDLSGEHRMLAQMTGRFLEALRNVLNEAEISRSAFDDLARDYLDRLRRHMRTEEELFFPVAERCLREADWAEIDAAAKRAADPLFGDKVAAECEALRQHLLAWDAEDRSAAQ